MLLQAAKVNFLICTDVAARGLDVKGLPFLINVNLPEDKANYVHRIGRVGRAERMGLAITLVATKQEKVWYHGQWCSSRGRNCYNTNLTTEKGCCTWNDDMRFLADIEEHLGVTIPIAGRDMKVEANEFDGKVVYGKKRVDTGEHSSFSCMSVLWLGLTNVEPCIYFQALVIRDMLRSLLQRCQNFNGLKKRHSSYFFTILTE